MQKYILGIGVILVSLNLFGGYIYLYQKYQMNLFDQRMKCSVLLSKTQEELDRNRDIEMFRNAGRLFVYYSPKLNTCISGYQLDVLNFEIDDDRSSIKNILTGETLFNFDNYNEYLEKIEELTRPSIFMIDKYLND